MRLRSAITCVHRLWNNRSTTCSSAARSSASTPASMRTWVSGSPPTCSSRSTRLRRAAAEIDGAEGGAVGVVGLFGGGTNGLVEAHGVVAHEDAPLAGLDRVEDDRGCLRGGGGRGFPEHLPHH